MCTYGRPQLPHVGLSSIIGGVRLRRAVRRSANAYRPRFLDEGTVSRHVRARKDTRDDSLRIAGQVHRTFPLGAGLGAQQIIGLEAGRQALETDAFGRSGVSQPRVMATE